jgi:transcriptional regulator with XRE-family HTH domain
MPLLYIDNLHLSSVYHILGEKMIKKRPDWAQRLRDSRENKKLSQKELVKRLKSNQTTIVYYELGEREPRMGYLMGLIRETGVDGNWLLTGKGDMYGEGRNQITKEEAIKVLFGDRADEVVLTLLDAIKNPSLRAILYTRLIDIKEKHKDLFEKTGDSSKT